MFGVPVGVLGGNEDREHHLHLQPRISLERLRMILDGYHARLEIGPVFVACFFHPYDLTERGEGLTDQMAVRWREFAAYQREFACQFLTLKAAKETYDLLQTGGKIG